MCLLLLSYSHPFIYHTLNFPFRFSVSFFFFSCQHFYLSISFVNWTKRHFPSFLVSDNCIYLCVCVRACVSLRVYVCLLYACLRVIIRVMFVCIHVYNPEIPRFTFTFTYHFYVSSVLFWVHGESIDN
jgi:hypothetical protein